MNIWHLFHRWDIWAMLISLGVVLGFELLGVFTTRYVTITWLTTNYVPDWALAMIWGWLGWHFIWRYH
jgi:hypothetical protein